LLVVFFGAEEVGLQGSSYFVNHAPIALEQVDLMINYDTVGQVTDSTLYVSGVGTAANLRDMAQAANLGALTLSLAEGGWSGSDHMVFNTREVPVLFVFGGPYRQYNTPADTWETLNYPGLEAVADYGFRLAVQAVTRPENSTWVMVAQPELRDDDDGPQNRSSWLGTLPDFTEDLAGYKLAGVFEGSPAAEAGLLKGDILVTLAGHEVTDLPTFTRALRANNPGDLVEITLLRDGSSLNFTVVLGDRKDRK
jgi:membrane-associated protease RseP (regulator of RpoE activity)